MAAFIKSLGQSPNYLNLSNTVYIQDVKASWRITVNLSLLSSFFGSLAHRLTKHSVAFIGNEPWKVCQDRGSGKLPLSRCMYDSRSPWAKANFLYVACQDVSL